MRLDFCGFGGRGGWMDVTQREAVGDMTFFLELGAYTLLFILRAHL